MTGNDISWFWLSVFQFSLVPQRLSRLQRMLDARLSFLGRQQFYKGGPLQLQEPFLIDQAAGRQLASAHDMRYFGADQVVML